MKQSNPLKRIVQRSKTLSEQDKLLVEEEIRMHMAYDWFIDDNPDVQERIAKGEERGEKRGEERGELRALRQIAMDIVKNRFHSLTQLAQEKVAFIQAPDLLRQLVLQISSASDEIAVQHLLNALEMQ